MKIYLLFEFTPNVISGLPKDFSFRNLTKEQCPFKYQTIKSKLYLADLCGFNQIQNSQNTPHSSQIHQFKTNQALQSDIPELDITFEAVLNNYKETLESYYKPVSSSDLTDTLLYLADLDVSKYGDFNHLALSNITIGDNGSLKSDLYRNQGKTLWSIQFNYDPPGAVTFQCFKNTSGHQPCIYPLASYDSVSENVSIFSNIGYNLDNVQCSDIPFDNLVLPTFRPKPDPKPKKASSDGIQTWQIVIISLGSLVSLSIVIYLFYRFKLLQFLRKK